MTSHRFLLLCCALLCALGTPSFAGDDGEGCPGGECLIAGDTAICPGGSTELCGPEGYAWYTWTLPNDTVWQARCLSVDEPGIYRLVVSDADLCKQTCEVEVKIQEAVPCEISGERSICDGGSTELCAPEGLALYAWTGPAGFVSKERCVEATVAGTYSFEGLTQDGCATSCEAEVVLQDAAPCQITGNVAICDGGSAELCGPEGYASYVWTGPEDFVGEGRCIEATAFGAYELTVTSEAGCVTSCTHDLGVVDIFEPCEISGDLQIDLGGSTELCGPQEALTYAWTGPGEFSGDDRCVTVDTPGTYQLVMDLGFGCSSECSVEVSVAPDPLPSCPRPDVFWAQQCFKAPVDFTVQDFSDLSKCVDVTATPFDWEDGSELEEFCAAVDPPAPIDIFDELLRQYVTMLANMCAGEMGLSTFEGQAIKLDPQAIVTCEGRSGQTVAEVLEDAAIALTPAKGEDLGALEQLVLCMIAINDGTGLELACEPDDDLGEAGLGGGPFGPGPDGAQGERQIALNPNPFALETVVSFAVPGEGMVEIAVYDVAGRRVRSLVQGMHAAGTYRVQWDGHNERGVQMPRGVYYVRGVIAGQARTARVLYIK